MNNSKKFIVNDQLYISNKPITLKDLIIYFKYNPSLLVIEYNSSICNKEDWKNITISNDAKIEIVTIVGGG